MATSTVCTGRAKVSRLPCPTFISISDRLGVSAGWAGCCRGGAGETCMVGWPGCNEGGGCIAGVACGGGSAGAPGGRVTIFGAVAGARMAVTSSVGVTVAPGAGGNGACGGSGCTVMPGGSAWACASGTPAARAAARTAVAASA